LWEEEAHKQKINTSETGWQMGMKNARAGLRVRKNKGIICFQRTAVTKRFAEEHFAGGR